MAHQRNADPARVRYQRIRAGLQQKDLAEKAGISRPHMSQIESGGVDASAGALARLAAALQCDIAELMPAPERGREPAPLIRRRRVAAGLSQRDLGRTAGVPYRRISLIELGQVEASEDELRKLASALTTTEERKRAVA